MNSLVIFGAVDDPRVIRVGREVASRGYNVNVLDPVGSHPVSANMCSRGRSELEICAFNLKTKKNFTLPVDGRYSVWWRTKRKLDYILSVENQQHYFAISEITAFFRALIERDNVDHFNDRRSVYAHENKLIQLEIARSVGWKVPKSLASSAPDDVIKFINSNKRTISKPLHLNFIPPPLEEPERMVNIMGNIVCEEDIIESGKESIQIAPTLFQEYVEKEYEIRLIVFGDGAIAYKVDSQGSRFGDIDWRRGQFENIYSQMPVPDELLDLGARYLLRAGLKYGVFDVIAEPSGEYVFLECNSDGQWAWLEGYEPGPMTRFFADRICELIRE